MYEAESKHVQDGMGGAHAQTRVRKQWHHESAESGFEMIRADSTRTLSYIIVLRRKRIYLPSACH
jgi:hypothetical protein